MEPNLVIGLINAEVISQGKPIRIIDRVVVVTVTSSRNRDHESVICVTEHIGSESRRNGTVHSYLPQVLATVEGIGFERSDTGGDICVSQLGATVECIGSDNSDTRRDIYVSQLGAFTKRPVEDFSHGRRKLDRFKSAFPHSAVTDHCDSVRKHIVLTVKARCGETAEHRACYSPDARNIGRDAEVNQATTVARNGPHRV